MSYKFKVGDEGKTRGGRAYRVICNNRKWVRPANGPTVIALLDPETTTLNGEELCNYDAHGKCAFSARYDLLPPTVKYLNVWYNTRSGDYDADIHPSESLAKTAAAEAYSKHAHITYLQIARPVEVQES